MLNFCQETHQSMQTRVLFPSSIESPHLWKVSINRLLFQNFTIGFCGSAVSLDVIIRNFVH